MLKAVVDEDEGEHPRIPLPPPYPVWAQTNNHAKSTAIYSL